MPSSLPNDPSYLKSVSGWDLYQDVFGTGEVRLEFFNWKALSVAYDGHICDRQHFLSTCYVLIVLSNIYTLTCLIHALTL